ncbi:MAG: hypothetical protein CR984_01600, partial [Proteobacteria bacterium]
EELMNSYALTAPKIANLIKFFKELLIVQQALIKPRAMPDRPEKVRTEFEVGRSAFTDLASNSLRRGFIKPPAKQVVCWHN